MTKDPACLFYINDWLTSTAEMDADCRGWYLNLLLHNYDKGNLPNDIEKLAVLCCVKFSEYERFEHVFEHVLKHKFEQIENNRLTNLRTQSILKGREQFKEKRSNAGKSSYLMRYFYEKYKKDAKDKKIVKFVKDNLNLEIDTKNEHMIEHMFKHLFELYRNENENENINVLNNKKDEKIEIFKSDLEITLDRFYEMRVKIKKPATDYAKKLILDELEKLANGDDNLKIEILKQSIKKNYPDVYPLRKQKEQPQTTNNETKNIALQFLTSK